MLPILMCPAFLWTPPMRLTFFPRVAALSLLLVLAGCGSSQPLVEALTPQPTPPTGEPSLGQLPPLTGFWVAPYLQNPTPQSMTVMFEPEVTEQAEVEVRALGATESQRVAAVAEAVQFNVTAPTRSEATPYTARLSGLRSNTTYEYRVHTDAGSTPWLRFKTWPRPGDGVETGRFMVISDTQSNNPHWLQRVMEEGLIAKDCEGDVHLCTERIHGIIISGDIVDTGSTLSQWRETFFGPARSAFAYVPVLPAIGNHDYTLAHYLAYFDLPDNGVPLHREEWYRADFLNLRLLTMQSNVIDPTMIPTQMRWATSQVQSAATDPGVDYVFMQMHHPCKSELWIPGESALTCRLIDQLIALSGDTGKISGHLFGHTHAYSRGQSRDVPHLWMNAASASGNIDDWGDFEQADYDEFESSWDEYGYSILEFATLGAPEVRSIRRSGGDDFQDYEDAFEGEYIRDQFVIGGENRRPEIPLAILPTGNVNTAEVILHADYRDADGDALHEAHWQLRQSVGSYQSPLIEEWGNETRQQNIWFRRDLNAGIDVDYWRVPYLPVGSYCWRVRYRDARLAWSPWSEEACFELSGFSEGANLVQNGGAEDGVASWTAAEGTLEAVRSLGCSPARENLDFSLGSIESFLVTAAEGQHYFAVGGCDQVSDRARAVQDIDLGAEAAQIDAGQSLGVLRAALRTFSKWDVPTARFRAYDAEGGLLGESKPLINQTGRWLEDTTSLLLPAGTRRVQIELGGVKQDGAVNDSFVDNVRFHLVTQTGARQTLEKRPRLSPGNGMALIAKKPDLAALEAAERADASP